jgi:hypothetical protein
VRTVVAVGLLGWAYYAPGVSHILHALSVSWSPAAIAAAVAGTINVTSNVIRDRNQRRREAHAGLRRERTAAYGELLARSYTLATRAQVP